MKEWTGEVMPTLTIELPEIDRSPEELKRDVRLAAAIDWYRQGLISQGRGAEIAGISRADFIDALAERRVDVVQIDVDSLKRELDFLERDLEKT